MLEKKKEKKEKEKKRRNLLRLGHQNLKKNEYSVESNYNWE